MVIESGSANIIGLKLFVSETELVNDTVKCDQIVRLDKVN